MKFGDEKLELKPERKFRNIGDIPRSITVWSMVIIVGVFLALVLSLGILTYPYSGGETILMHIVNEIVDMFM